MATAVAETLEWLWLIGSGDGPPLRRRGDEGEPAVLLEEGMVVSGTARQLPSAVAEEGDAKGGLRLRGGGDSSANMAGDSGRDGGLSERGSWRKGRGG